MTTLTRAIVAFFAATLGTTALVAHLPHPAPHPHHVALVAGLVAVDSPALVNMEIDLLHPRKPAYVPPPPAAEAPAAAPDASSPARFVAPAARPGQPPVSIGSTQQALINSDRAAAGLAPLTWNGCLASVAYQNADRMAAAGAISHANGVSVDMGCGLGSAQTGENVGYWSAGVNDGQLNLMFLNSPEHRANIMGPYRYAGTAWVVGKNGAGYIAVELG